MAHYNRGEVSCLEAMETAFGKANVAFYCAVNAFKYVCRLHELRQVGIEHGGTGRDTSCSPYERRGYCSPRPRT
jgi:hypothetical protein